MSKGMKCYKCGTTSKIRESKWKKFRVNNEPYNDAYYNMDIYKKFFN